MPDGHVLVQDITLQEALCGTTFEVAALDKRQLHVVSAPGEIIKPNDWKCIQASAPCNRTQPAVPSARVAAVAQQLARC